MLPADPPTFVFTDIEGSTRKWEDFPEAMPAALERHDALLHEAVARNGGRVFKTVGDAFCAVFPETFGAVAAVLEVQQALARLEWEDIEALRVRAGIHAGRAEERGGDYFGATVNRVARLQDIGHGGQTLLSAAAAAQVQDGLPSGAWLKDLGSHRLKDLGQPEHVFQLCHPGLLDDFPALRSLQAFANNLPLQTSSFIGRAQEMAELENLLARHRLVTLLGAGGTGKTRLALQAAAGRLEDHGDGVWFLDLAPITDAALVPVTLAKALGVREESGRALSETLTDFLRAKKMLLILDNCEHLIGECASLAHSLLQTCPDVRILATSREALAVPGERTWRVPVLSLPDPQGLSANEKNLDAVLLEFDAVRLFVERARSVREGFMLSRSNAAAVCDICLRLDGIPLALELAAARVRMLSVKQIQARLDDRFRLLTGGARTALPRQQTLQALIDWSYDLLSIKEKALFGRLSVFSGGWMLEAAEAVCTGDDIRDTDVLDLLTGLADKSLVVVEEEDASVRYRMLETVRQYALERLREAGGDARPRARHRDFYLALAEEAEPFLHGPDQVVWLSRLKQEHDNLRVALEFCETESLDADDSCLRLCALLGWFWYIGGYFSEGRRRLKKALDRPQEKPVTKTRAQALRAAGTLAWNQCDYPAARDLYEDGLSIFRQIGDRQGIAQIQNSLGNIAWSQGDYASARRLYQESLDAQRQRDDQQGIAVALNNLGMVVFAQGDPLAARGFYEEGLVILRRIGNQQGIAMGLNHLGSVALMLNDSSAARRLYEEGLEIQRGIGDRPGIAMSLACLGDVALSQGACLTARGHYEESLNIKRQLGDLQGIAVILNMLGSVAMFQGDGRAAHASYQESLVIGRQIGDQSAIAFALAGLGETALLRSDPQAARGFCEEGLTIGTRIGKPIITVVSLEGLASVTAVEGRSERAARLWGAADALRERIGTPLPPSERARLERRIDQVRLSLGDAAFSAAFAVGRSLTPEQVVEEAQESRLS